MHTDLRRTNLVRLSPPFAAAMIAFAMCWLAGAKASAHDYDDYDHRHEHGRLMLALDMDYSAALEHSEIDQGGGAGIRVGFERDLFLVTLIPELQLDAHHFNANTPDNATISTAKIGGRIRFLKIIEPGIFAHAGLGHVGGDRVYEHTGIAFDAGFTIDLTILPLIDIGLHTAWNHIFGEEDISYATAGAHLALVL